MLSFPRSGTKLHMIRETITGFLSGFLRPGTVGHKSYLAESVPGFIQLTENQTKAFIAFSSMFLFILRIFYML